MVGAIGVGLLLWPKGGLSLAHVGWQLATLGACFCSALGAIYFRHVRTEALPLMFMGMEMLLGGLVLAVAGLGLGDAAHWQWTGRGDSRGSRS